MLQLKTTKLQELAAKAFKGVGNDRNKPITELIALNVENGLFTLITTDYDNFLYVSETVDCDDFYAVVEANRFVKLVSRLTSEDVTLDIVDNCLEVRANGKWSIPMEIDHSTGKVVDYTNPLATFEADEKIGEITAQDISTIIRALKPALATTVDIPEYVNYYFGETVLATDTNIASCYGKNLVTTPILVSAAVLEMLSVYTGETPLEIFKTGNKLMFRGTKFNLFGYAMPGVDNFNVSAINSYLESAYPSMCKIPKQTVLQALDRLSLFVSDFDEDIINVRFTDSGLIVSSKQSDSEETIEYIESDNLTDIDSSIYLFMLVSQIKAQTGDTVDIYFGTDTSIKIVDSACDNTSVLCLIQ